MKITFRLKADKDIWIESDKMDSKMCELYGPVELRTSPHQKTEVKFQNLPNFKMVETVSDFILTITLFKE